MAAMSWLSVIPFVVLAAAFVVSVRRDPRWTGNAFLLSGALLALFLVTPSSGGASWARSAGPAAGGGLGSLVVLVLILSPVLLIALVGFLLANGLQMARKEGRSLGNLLSGLAGLGILGVLVLFVVSVLKIQAVPPLLPISLLAVMGCMWAGYLFGSYLLYTLIYPMLARWAGARFVMVHGSGLIRGKVPPLLARRVDKGIALWSALTRTVEHPRLILSGGQGADEPRSEASAMAEYAIAQGVPERAIVLEDASATTEENIANTRELVLAELGPDARGVTVTSSYHVLRTASLARAEGLDAQVQGARTAGYFWPSAFLREFVALLARRPVLHALLAAIVCLPLPIALAAVMITGR